MQAEAATAPWPAGEALVDLAWYKGGQLAVLAAPRAPLGGAARASAGAEPAGGAARLLLLPWDAVRMRRLELRPGMATVLLQARRPHLARSVASAIPSSGRTRTYCIDLALLLSPKGIMC
jgi:hypothetical protein